MRRKLLAMLKLSDMTEAQLACNLFVSRETVRRHIRELRAQGKVHRRFFHNLATQRPDYMYSILPASARRQPQEQISAPHIDRIVGDWDVVPMYKVRK